MAPARRWPLLRLRHTRPLLALLLAVPLPAQTPLRIACAGDSITFGSRLPDREHLSYPALLGELLGRDAVVANFGCSGATLLAAGNKPWRTQAEATALRGFAPDVVVLALGTNDSKQKNWQHGGDFAADYQQLVGELQALPSHPRVVLVLPFPAFCKVSGDGDIDGAVIHDEIVPAVRAVAAATGCELLDLHTPLLAHAGWFPDGVHPDPHGAEAIARAVYAAIRAERDPGFDLTRALAKAEVAAQPGEFEGFRQLDFALPDGTGCRIACPRQTGKGRPWIWRARFWGHEPQFDRAMLERGFHVGYCDTAGLYGAPAAVARWDAFYALTQQLGLAKQPVLEGMSRGGLIVYRWASAHPDCTAGIYADNPVCDFRSWPGGAGASPQREAEWQECLRAYGIGAAAADTVPQPIDLLAPLAKAAVPLLHIVGAADTVVPVAENTDIVEQRYRALGGSIEVIRKPEKDHHPHSLPDPQPIVDFALRATGRNIVFAALAQPGVEWRAQPAGWGAGSWRDQHEAIVALGAAHPDLRVVCLGDSITQGLTGARDRQSHQGGERAFDRAFANGAAGFGISGDRTEHVLWRIQHGEFGAIDPAVIVLTIGVNNLSRGDRGTDVALGIEAIVRTLRTQEPQAKLLLLGCLPAGAADSRLRQQRAILQRDIVHLDDGTRVLVRDFDALFVQPDGSLHPDRVAGDGIHLTSLGQDAWLAALQPLVERLLAR